MVRVSRRQVLGGAAASAISFKTFTAHAQTPENFYSGRTILAMTSSPPGGGYDAYTRLVARHIQKHIPGHPTIIVQNMPGAGGIVLANYLYNVSPKDGSVFALLDRGAMTAPLIYGEASKARFDPLGFTWIGNMAREAGVGVVSTKAPAKTIEDMKTTEVYFGASGQETDGASYVRLFNELFGTRIKVIANYPGQTQTFISIERGELHGLFVTGYSAGAKKYVEGQIAKGTMQLFVQMTMDKDPTLPDVPGVFDKITKSEDRQVVELLLTRLTLGRPFIAPPSVPEDRALVLRTAFENVLADPELLAEAEKMSLPVELIKAAEARNLIRTVYAAPPSVIERTRKILRAD